MSRGRGWNAWRVVGSVVAALGLGFGTANTVSALAHDAWRQQRVIDDPVTIVDVANSTGGAVTIVGDEHADAITIDMIVIRGLETPTHSERLEGNRLVVRSSCLWVVGLFCQIDYRIRVPHGVSVIAHADGRTIEVSNVDGFLDLSSSGGSVLVRGGESQSVRLDSDGGSVEATGLSAVSVEASSRGGHVLLDLATAPMSVVGSSDGGDVEIVLPDTPDVYRVDVSSNGGSTRADVRIDPASEHSITARSNGGDMIVRYG
jgi:hypothetical protein